MNDAAFTLAQTNRDRKTIAHSASHRVNGSKSKRCTLPSDNLSPAKLRELSGPVSTYDMSKPHPWAELRNWPKDLLREYMQKLLDMAPSNAELGELLQYNPVKLYVPLAEAGIRRKRGGWHPQTKEQAAAWEAFSRGELSPAPAEIPSQEAAEATEAEPEPQPGSCVTSVSLDLANHGLADLVQTLLTDPLLQQLTGSYDISLTIKKT